MATISLLPVSLALVHIPRSRLPQLSHPILTQILLPNPTFLNITCNELELSIFAEQATLQDFELISRKDRRKTRENPVEITFERWSVLQIDSHNETTTDSGARVSELSAPLADAGISILYQSSYMSDFIFVKEIRLREVMGISASAGFDLYSPEFTASPPTSPIPEESLGRSETLQSSSSAATAAVFTRARSSTDPSTAATTNHPLSFPAPKPLHSKSLSPASVQVSVLAPDLTCVGLSDDNAEHWSLKIIKLMAFPDLIPTSPSTQASKAYVPPPAIYTSTRYESRPASPYGSSSSGSSDSDEEGYFSHSPARNLSTSSLVTSAASKSNPDLPGASSQEQQHSGRQTSVSEDVGASRSRRSSHTKRSFSKHSLSTLTPLTPTPFSSAGLLLKPESVPQQTTPPKQAYKVPFFSFTRTAEGSSVTTSARTLAQLFPPSERYMVICGGELDLLDQQGDVQDEDDADSESHEHDDEMERGMLKCLQIDLSQFGLDKHGLVNRFSRVLEENHINHMYSSTYKTANLLVDKKDAKKAQRLLQTS